jgi:hypothetical protein
MHLRGSAGLPHLRGASAFGRVLFERGGMRETEMRGSRHEGVAIMARPRTLTIELEDHEGAIGLDDAIEDARRMPGSGPLAQAMRDAHAALVRIRATAKELEAHVTALEDESDELESGIEVDPPELDMFPYALWIRVQLDWLSAQRGARRRTLVAHLDAVLELVVALEGSTLTIELNSDAVTADVARRTLAEAAPAIATLRLPGIDDD